jgi:hypothetical protein
MNTQNYCEFCGSDAFETLSVKGKKVFMCPNCINEVNTKPKNVCSAYSCTAPIAVHFEEDKESGFCDEHAAKFSESWEDGAAE